MIKLVVLFISIIRCTHLPSSSTTRISTNIKLLQQLEQHNRNSNFQFISVINTQLTHEGSKISIACNPYSSSGTQISTSESRGSVYPAKPISHKLQQTQIPIPPFPQFKALLPLATKSNYKYDHSDHRRTCD